MQGKAFGAALLALLLLGAGARFGVLAWTFPARPSGDELYYIGTAINIAEGNGHLFNVRQRAFRPPAQSFWLSRFVDVDLRQERLDPGTLLPRLVELDRGDPDADLVRFLRPLLGAALLLGVVLVPLTALLGRALFDARTGCLAGAFALGFPTLVAFSHYLLSETLFAVLLTGGIALSVSARDRGSAPLALAAGLCFGLAGLTREIGAAAGAVCAIWALASAAARDRRAAALRGALLVAATALVILPWTWRNHALFGRLVPVSTVGWFAAGEGNTLEDPDWLEPAGKARMRFKIRFFQLDDEIERVDFARDYTLEQIRAEQPWWLPRKLVKNLGLLVNPDSVPLDKLRRGAYAGASTAAARTLLVGQVVAWALALGLAAWGIATARGDGRRSLALLLIGLVCAVHVLANATPRFRVPWLPLLFVYAAHAVLRWRELLAPGARRALAVPAAALVFLAWSAHAFFAEQSAAVWSYGVEEPERRP